jgi:hypothetical protein
VGAAASVAVKNRLLPRGVYQEKLKELQDILQQDDCFLPGKPRKISELSLRAELTASEGDPEPLRNGVDRPVGDVDNGWTSSLNGWVQYTFPTRESVRELRLVFDSNLNRADTNVLAWYPLDNQPVDTPETLVRAFRVEALDGEGNWTEIAREDNNYQRLVRIHTDVETHAVRLIPEQTWGAEKAHLFAWEVRQSRRRV